MNLLYSDLQYRILVEINFETLHHICSINACFYNLCKNDCLWSNRIEYEFGIQYLKNKPSHLSFKNYYGQLWLFNLIGWNIDDYIKDGYWNPDFASWHRVIENVISSGNSFAIKYLFSILDKSKFPNWFECQ